MSRATRLAMIDRTDGVVSLSRQCRLVGISRSSLYYRPKTPDAATLDLMRRIDEQYLKTPFYGSRKMAAWLREQGCAVGRDRGPPSDAAAWPGGDLSEAANQQAGSRP